MIDSVQLKPADVVAVLGGSGNLDKRVRSFQDLADTIESGLPVAAMESVVKILDFTARELSQSLRIPERTLIRMRKRERLAADESDKLYRLAYIIALAEKALGKREKAQAWLRRPNRALGGAVPLFASATQPGLQQVEQVLGRIEYGGIS